MFTEKAQAIFILFWFSREGAENGKGSKAASQLAEPRAD
jgi:hypothetical protein